MTSSTTHEEHGPRGEQSQLADPLSDLEDRLLRGARLRSSHGAAGEGQRFHVRLEDLLGETDRRGTARRLRATS